MKRILSLGLTSLLLSPLALATPPNAYITPSPGADTIYNFAVDTDSGLLTTFTTAYTNNMHQYGQLTFAIVGGIQYAYVVDQNGYVYQCTLKVDGSFNTCTATPQSPPSWAPHGIAFATVNEVQYGYITDVNEGNVYQCSLNTDGTFNTCSLAINTPFNAPYGIAFATLCGKQYAYIAEAVSANSSTGSMYRCSLNNDGTFNKCIATPAQNVPSWIPYAVAFASFGGIQYAYVADNGTNPANGHVYKCTLDSDGFFNRCVSTPSNAPTVNWVPSDLAFATIDGVQYAYITNYQASIGGVYRCKLNNNGSFTICDATPVTPPSGTWTPVGIAFRIV